MERLEQEKGSAPAGGKAAESSPGHEVAKPLNWTVRTRYFWFYITIDKKSTSANPLSEDLGVPAGALVVHSDRDTGHIGHRERLAPVNTGTSAFSEVSQVQCTQEEL